MESNIVQDFQNLRVFSNHNINRMDELVQDLSNALEESAKSCPRGAYTQENAISSGAVARRYHKRRRGARRATCNLYGKRGTISEASESSVDEAVRDHHENSVVTHSDSDELSMVYPKQRLKVPMSEPVPPVESDSFTENLSPMRPQRRRRRFKHMAVDSLQAISQMGSSGEGCVKRSSTPTSMPSTSSVSEQRRVMHCCQAHAGDSHSPGSIQSIIPGKRKRGSKSQREVKSMDQRGVRDKHSVDVDSMDMTSLSQESSLSSSEVDSDVYNNADEGREADDEQSDFFHEPEECTLPEMIPWWEGEGVIDNSMSPSQEEFDQLLSGALSLMSSTSQRNFRKQVDKFMARAEGGREIRIGRRKLKGNIPRYTMMRFLQDQERWSSMQGAAPAGSHVSPGASWNSGGYSSQSGDYKRLRQTPPPPPDSAEEGPAVVNAVPIPESSSSSSLGSKMLPTMGWTPDSGLGPNGDRHQDPVIAYRRRSRKGLGYDTLSDT